MTIPSDLQSYQALIEQGAFELQATRYSIAAVFSLCVYDWIISIREEYDLIHCARWTCIKIAYLICRYYPLVIFPILSYAFLGNHTYQECEKLIHPLYLLMIPCQLSAQTVMIMRSYAFTGRSKLVLVVLLTCFFALAGAELWLFGSQFKAAQGLFIVLGPTSGCFGNEVTLQDSISAPSTSAGIVFLCVFFLDFMATATVAIHCVRIRTTQGPLGRLFLLQGMVAFVTVSILNLLVAVLFLGGNRAYCGVGLPFAIALPDIIACRLILLLRRRISPTQSQELLEQSRIVREGLELLDLLDRQQRLRELESHTTTHTHERQHGDESMSTMDLADMQNMQHQHALSVRTMFVVSDVEEGKRDEDEEQRLHREECPTLKAPDMESDLGMGTSSTSTEETERRVVVDPWTSSNVYRVPSRSAV